MADSDKYINVDAPAGKAFAITPSDAVDLEKTTRGIWLGTAGNIKVIMADDTEADAVTFQNVQDGTFLPFRIRRVYSTGTNVTGIIGVH